MEIKIDTSLRTKALRLSYFTVGYNIIEGIVSVIAGFLAGSIALTGFGLDSFVESLSGGVMIWRLTRPETMSESDEEKAESRALKLIGITFIVLGVYVLYESVSKLYSGEKPEPSIFGIIIAIISILMMAILFHQKYITGQAMGSKSLIADSKETLACILLSISLLFGLGLNYLYGLWWADPVAGIVIVAFLFREGYEALSGAD